LFESLSLFDFLFPSWERGVGVGVVYSPLKRE